MEEMGEGRRGGHLAEALEAFAGIKHTCWVRLVSGHEALDLASTLCVVGSVSIPPHWLGYLLAS
jgi:hypothetical protein